MFICNQLIYNSNFDSTTERLITPSSRQSLVANDSLTCVFLINSFIYWSMLLSVYTLQLISGICLHRNVLIVTIYQCISSLYKNTAFIYKHKFQLSSGHANDCSFLHLLSSETLQWRHIGRDGVSNHHPRDCLLRRLFRRRSKKTSKFCVTGLCAWNSPVTESRCGSDNLYL